MVAGEIEEVRVEASPSPLEVVIKDAGKSPELDTEETLELKVSKEAGKSPELDVEETLELKVSREAGRPPEVDVEEALELKVSKEASSGSEGLGEEPVAGLSVGVMVTVTVLTPLGRDWDVPDCAVDELLLPVGTIMLASLGSPDVTVKVTVVNETRRLEVLVPKSWSGSGVGVTLVPVSPGSPEDPGGITPGTVTVLVVELDRPKNSAGLTGSEGPGAAVDTTDPVFGGTKGGTSTEVVMVTVSKTTSVAVPSVSAGGIVTVVTTVPKIVVVVVTAMKSLF